MSAKRISEDAKKALFNYFDGCDFPINDPLPRHNSPGHAELDTIISQFGLQRDQAARQLRKWKDSKFHIDANLFTSSPAELAQQIAGRISLSPLEILVTTLEGMIPGDSVIHKSRDEQTRFALAQSDPKMEIRIKLLLQLFTSSSSSIKESMVIIFTDLIDSYSLLIASNVPKNVQMIAQNEFSFSLQREDVALQNCEKFISPATLFFGFNLTIIESRILFLGIEMVLFMQWSKLHYNRESPSIMIRKFGDVYTHPYSHQILYYTTGWLLRRLVCASTEKQNMKKYFSTFSRDHSVSLSVAKEKCLPTTLTERRQLSKLLYSDELFFKFIQFIESIYVDNLTLEMMIAFDDGSLIEQISEGIREDVDVKCVFLELCSPNNTDEVNHFIFDFILLRYKRMRGRWFVKSMQAEQGRKYKVVEDLPTRTRVMVATEGAKSSSVDENFNEIIDGKSKDDDDVNSIVDGLAELYISAENNLIGYDSNDEDNNSIN